MDKYTDYRGDGSAHRVNFAKYLRRSAGAFRDALGEFRCPDRGNIELDLRRAALDMRGFGHPNGGAPAPAAQEATPASSDEYSIRDTCRARLRFPPSEDIEQALVSSAADEHAASKADICKTKQEEKEPPIDDVDSQGAGRPIIRFIVPQGIGRFEESPPRGASEGAAAADVGFGLAVTFPASKVDG